MPSSPIDVLVIGAGAAGLTAAIHAAEIAAPGGQRVLVLESARRPGAKILVSGGGRCNVTNSRVSSHDFCGASQATIRKVLAEFDEQRTIAWFGALGVGLKLEPDGKYFPISDSARSVLDALLLRTSESGAELITDARVTEIVPQTDGFRVRAVHSGGDVVGYRARRVIVATGGRALPKSGSDGAVMDLLGGLGHSIIPNTPALTPLLLRAGLNLSGRFAAFKGIAVDGRLRILLANRILAESAGPVLFTHFGLSGPAPMNLSRHWLRLRLEDPDAALSGTLGLSQFPDSGAADRWITEYAKANPRQHVATMLMSLVPERLAHAMAMEAGAGGREGSLSHLTRNARRDLAQLLSAMPIDIIGTRGYSHAEATAGGIDLREVDVRTMQSRLIPGLYLCGEILDVDGRIGGFNFQWAWSTGYLAGRAAGAITTVKLPQKKR